MLEAGRNRYSTYLQHNKYNMSRFLDTILSTIAPHDCVACGTTGSLICNNCLSLLPDAQSRCYKCHKLTKDYSTCSVCITHSSLEKVYVVTDYETVAKTLVYGSKFERKYAAALSIADAMVLRFSDILDDQGVLCHLPTATSRVRQRGYDQSKLIARSLAKRTNALHKTLLWRRGQHRQPGSSRNQRLSQLQNAFHARATTSRHVFLVDDVMTTGASLETAAKTLQASGVPRVSAIVFARAE